MVLAKSQKKQTPPFLSSHIYFIFLSSFVLIVFTISVATLRPLLLFDIIYLNYNV